MTTALEKACADQYLARLGLATARMQASMDEMALICARIKVLECGVSIRGGFFARLFATEGSVWRQYEEQRALLEEALFRSGIVELAYEQVLLDNPE